MGRLILYVCLHLIVEKSALTVASSFWICALRFVASFTSKRHSLPSAFVPSHTRTSHTMVATTSLLAVLAATAPFITATQDDSHKGSHQHNDQEHGEGVKVDHQFGHADIPDYGDHHYYAKDHHSLDHTYTVYSPRSSHYSISIPHIKPRPSTVVKPSSASFKPYFPPKPSYKSSSHDDVIVSRATPAAVSKRSTSPFIDPFASSTKDADGGGFVAIPYYTPSISSSSSGGKIEITSAPVPSKGFSTIAAGNATAPRTTLSLFNACSGTKTNSTSCKEARDITYFASVVSAVPSATVFAIDCSKRGRNGSTTCFDKAMTVTQGASMFARVDDFEDDARGRKTVSCGIISRTASAVCTETYAPTASAAASASASVASIAAIAPKSSGNATANANATMGSTFAFGREQIYYNDLVVTAGVEKLGGGASRTPVAPSSASFTAAAAVSGSASANAAVGALGAPAARFAGVAAIVFAVLVV